MSLVDLKRTMLLIGASRIRQVHENVFPGQVRPPSWVVSFFGERRKQNKKGENILTYQMKVLFCCMMKSSPPPSRRQPRSTKCGSSEGSSTRRSWWSPPWQRSTASSRGKIERNGKNTVHASQPAQRQICRYKREFERAVPALVSAIYFAQMFYHGTFTLTRSTMSR